MEDVSKMKNTSDGHVEHNKIPSEDSNENPDSDIHPSETTEIVDHAVEMDAAVESVEKKESLQTAMVENGAAEQTTATPTQDSGAAPVPDVAEADDVKADLSNQAKPTESKDEIIGHGDVSEVGDNADVVEASGASEKPAGIPKATSPRGKRGPSSDDVDAETGKKKRKRKKDGNESDESEDEREWVCCDKCKKWRILPITVQAKTLPDQWYCEMNVYDPKRSTCEAAEQTLKQIAKERKRAKKRARQQKLLEEKEQLVTQSSSNQDKAPPNTDQASKSAPKQGEITTTPKKGKRSSPSDEAIRSPRPDGSEKPEKKKKGKKSKSLQTKEVAAEPVAAEPEPPVEPKKKKRGRPARERTPEEIRAQEQAEADNVEWVQCEKCDKWRKLPPHISADELPDVWYCTMNYWYPSSASCDAPEDKADAHHQDVGVAGLSQGSVGKFSYRSLIFGNGRKVNRPMSERTRAAESLFARPIDEVKNPYPTVMYSKSSAFLPRTSNFNKATVVEDAGPSVFDVLGASNLWAELRQTAQSNATGSSQSHPTYNSLAGSVKTGIKEMILQSLGSLTLTGDQIVFAANCRQLEDASLGEIRAYCNADNLMNALLDLVCENLVEITSARDLTVPTSQWIPQYRKVRRRPEVDQAMKSSRCMKISKPWKRSTTSF